MKLQFFPIDIDYDKQENAIKIYGRTKEGKKIIAFDNSVKDYFWVLTTGNQKRINKEILNIKYEDDQKTYYVEKSEVQKKSYNGEPVEAIKVTLTRPSDKRIISDLINQISGVESKKEIDIPLKKKYWQEKGITPLTLCEAECEEKEGKIKIKKIISREETYDMPKVLAFDIETYAPTGSYSNETRDPIIMMALYAPGFKRVITWKKFHTENETIIFKKDEKEMLEEFFNLIEKYNPDYLIGYFSDNFDMPYIKARAAKYKMPFKLAGETIVVKRGFVRSKGIIHLDMFKFIKKIMGYSLKTENYSLDAVAEELIGEKKLEMDFVKGFLAWDTRSPELEYFCKYNLHDARITYKIAKKIMPNINELTKIIGQPAADLVRMSYGQMVEWYLIKKAHQYNEICPNRPGANKIGERRIKSYKGAFVYEPQPGLYERIVVMDFKGLYPSIIATHNISAITYTENPKEGIITPPIETDEGKEVHYYFKRKEGFITKAIKELIEKRNEIKRKLKRGNKDPSLKARVYALKTVANASYGYMGFFAARWYSKEAAEAVTAYGRFYITKTIKEAKKQFKVIYGDTDSILLLQGSKSKEQVERFLKEINDNLPGYMELELEGFFPRGVFVMKKNEAIGAKKKYALLDEEGEIIIKGFETIRRDWSKLAKKAQMRVLNLILKDNNPQKAFRYIQDVIDRIRKKKFDIEDMIIQTTLQRPIDTYQQIGPHVAVARRMLEKGMYVTTGTSIRYVISEGKGQIKDKARIPEEANDYDAEYYVNNQIIPAIERIFEALGYKKEDLTKEKSQTTLGEF